MAKPFHKKETVEEGAPEWVVTFGDLMSLLLCFFVLLLSFSEMDRQKYKLMSGSMAKAFGVQRKRSAMGIPLGNKMVAKDFDQETIALDLRESLAREIRKQVEIHLKGMEDLVQVHKEKDNIIIRLMGETTFDSGKAEIRREMGPLLEKIGNMLQETKGNIIIGGHTDNIPVKGGPYGSNLILSMARAASVAEFLLDKTTLDPYRIATMGFGPYRPLESNDTPEGRRKNRRVEIIITSLSFQE
jgi:chemotaxis protein MotB